MDRDMTRLKDDNPQIALAEYLGVTWEDVVNATMAAGPTATFGLPERRKMVVERAKNMGAALKACQKLIHHVSNFSQPEVFTMNGGHVGMYHQVIGLEELIELNDYLEWQLAQHNRWLEITPSKGGKNHEAHGLAEVVRQLFRHSGREITWGHNEGRPSTEFGRAVEFALSAYGCDAAWEAPTKAAWKRRDDPVSLDEGHDNPRTSRLAPYQKGANGAPYDFSVALSATIAVERIQLADADDEER